jgi:hypothetical protein
MSSVFVRIPGIGERQARDRAQREIASVVSGADTRGAIAESNRIGSVREIARGAKNEFTKGEAAASRPKKTG